jgi:hypothetical protein
MTAEEALQTLGTDAQRGLDTEEARRLLSEYGPNELVERAAKSPWRMLLAQFTETMVVILLIAAVVSGFLGKLTETIAVLAIVLMFSVLGFVQEYRPERAMAALKRMAVPTVRVRREGQVREFPARELGRGDILLLEAGNPLTALAIAKELDIARRSIAPWQGKRAHRRRPKPYVRARAPGRRRRGLVLCPRLSRGQARDRAGAAETRPDRGYDWRRHQRLAGAQAGGHLV